MRIIFTRHAQKKFKFLKKLGWNVNRQDIKAGLEKSVKTQKGYSGTKASLKSISKTHNVRIVYNETGDIIEAAKLMKLSEDSLKARQRIITIITFYPVRKGRYDQN